MSPHPAESQRAAPAPVADMTELLHKHRPVLRYDAQDPFRACAADTIAINPGNKLLDGRGKPIAVAADGAHPLSLELLKPGDKHAGERLDERGDERSIERDALRLQADERWCDRVYGRVLTRNGLTYLQYWFWFYYNPKDVAGRGRHEGDWEMIQLRLDGEEPCAVYAQHDHARKEAWDRVRRHPAPDGPQPVVYVAAESHASYFEDGTHPAFGRADNAYGDGPELSPQVKEFGDWSQWPGRWGNSRGVFAWIPWVRNPPAGRSPKSPGHQGAKWSDPAKFERDAAQNKPRKQSWLWRLGCKTYPPAPTILDARFSGTSVMVDYQLQGRFLRRRARHLLLSVHSPDARGDVLARRSLVNAPRRGTATLELSHPPSRAVLLASSFNRRRQRSDIVSRELI